MSNSQKYWAFLSYAHADTAVADWVHEALETYRIPHSLAGRQITEGSVPSRLFPIFRDRSELAASSDLHDSLQEALRNSYGLVVLCSPASKESKWVNEEIRFFQRAAPGRPIVPVLVQGEPGDAFPAALIQAKTRDEAAEERYPLAVDLRSGPEARNGTQLRLVSAVLGLSFDEVVGRDRQRRNGRMLEVAHELLERGDDAELAASLALDVIRSAIDWREQEIQLRAEASLYEAFSKLRHIRTLVQGAAISSLTISPKGDQLVSSDDSGNVRMWSVHRGEMLEEFSAQKSAASYVTFNSNGTRIVVAWADGTVRVFDAERSFRQTSQFAASGRAIYCEFATDGTAIVAVTASGAIHYWPIDGMQRPRQVSHLTNIKCAKVNRDGSLLATSSHDTVRIWRTSDLSLAAELVDASNLLDLTFNDDSSRLAAGSLYCMAYVWDLPDFSEPGGLSSLWRWLSARCPQIPPTPLQGHLAPVVSCAFGTDGTELITVSRDNTARIWDLYRKLEAPKVLQGEGDALLLKPAEVQGWCAKVGNAVGNATLDEEEKRRAAEYIDEGRMGKDFANTSLGHRVAFVKAFLELTSMEAWYEANGAICTGALSTNGEIVAKPSKDCSVSLFEYRAGRKRTVLRGHQTRIRSLAFSKDNALIATGDENGEIRLWNSGDRRDLNDHMFETSSILKYVLNHDKSQALALLENGGFSIWDLGIGHRRAHLKERERVSICGAFSVDGKLIAIGDEEGTLRILSAVSGEVIFRKDEINIVQESFAEIERIKEARSLQKFDPDSWEGVNRTMRWLDQHTRAEMGEHFSPGFREVAMLWGDPAVAAYGSKHLYCYWYDNSTPDRWLQVVAKEDHATAFCLCPRRWLLIIALKGGRVELWDIRSMARIDFVETAEDVTTLAIHPSADFICIGCAMGTSFVWDPAEDRLTSLKGHERKVTHVSLSEQENRVVTSSSDGTARVWSADSGATLAVLRGHKAGSVSAVNCSSFSPDGRTLATCGADETLRMWNAETGEQLVTLPSSGACHQCSMVDNGTVLGATVRELLLSRHLPGGRSLVDVVSRSLTQEASEVELEGLLR
jgi:WD40 repeat protein